MHRIPMCFKYVFKVWKPALSDHDIKNGIAHDKAQFLKFKQFQEKYWENTSRDDTGKKHICEVGMEMNEMRSTGTCSGSSLTSPSA